jgi:hypothetical protein
MADEKKRRKVVVVITMALEGEEDTLQNTIELDEIQLLGVLHPNMVLAQEIEEKIYPMSENFCNRYFPSFSHITG